MVNFAVTTTSCILGVGEKNLSIDASQFSLQWFWIDSENFRIDSELSF